MFQPSISFEIPVARCVSDTDEQQRNDACTWAKEWIYLKSCCTEKPAAIFDIDATLIHKTTPLQSVVNLFHFCREKGVTCFLVTARPEIGRNETEKLLHELGIRDYKNAFFLSYDNAARISPSYVAGSKLAWREKISRRGYTIILNAGDAWTDHGETQEFKSMKKTFLHHTTVLFITQDGVLHIKLPEIASNK